MPIVATGATGTLEDVMNLARSIVADTLPGLTGTPGEGQILTDDPDLSPFTLQFVNSALRWLYRKLSNQGIGTMIKDNIIVTGLTPVNSTLGLGIPNPATQVSLGYTGYFDGMNVNSSLVLPSDCLSVIDVSERQSASGLPFTLMQQVARLESRNQYQNMLQWEYRQDAIWMIGSTGTTDLRLRYNVQLPIVGPIATFSSTTLPVVDCIDALAFQICYLYALARDAEAAPTLKAEAEMLIQAVKQRQVRNRQAITTLRRPYDGGEWSSNSGNRGGF